jgi:4-hydroxybenzoate polyprenyltransferase
MKRWRKFIKLKRLKTFAKLMRLRYVAQIVGIITIFSIASHGFSFQSLWAVISSLFLSIAIFFFDDAFDYESDQIVHKQRPIPKGYITVLQTYIWGFTFLAGGILLASFLLLYQFIIFLVITIVSLLIVFLKIKSILRAMLTAFIMGGLLPFAAFINLKILIFGFIVALPHFGGSIAKDFLHSAGDRFLGYDSPQYRFKYLISFMFFLSGIMLWIPLIMNLVTWYYVPPIIFTNISCIILGFNILKNHYEKVYVYGAIGMISSLLAFLLDGIFAPF